MAFFACTRKRSQRNCPFRTYFSKLSTEDMLVSASVDTASYFSLPISQLRGNEIRERQSYQDMPRLLALGSWILALAR